MVVLILSQFYFYNMIVPQFLDSHASQDEMIVRNGLTDSLTYRNPIQLTQSTKKDKKVKPKTTTFTPTATFTTTTLAHLWADVQTC